jgi:hypothetical protein
MRKLKLEILKPNFTKLTLGPLTLWFSYAAPISFFIDDTFCTRVNDWSGTTGRHLTACDGGTPEARAARVPGPVFETRLAAALTSLAAPAAVNENLRAALDGLLSATDGLMDLYEDESRAESYAADLDATSKARDLARAALAPARRERPGTNTGERA